MVILSLTAILLLLYFSLLQISAQAWESPISKEKYETKKNHSISVIIAARNEASGILTCLKAVLNNGPTQLLNEIIVVDDHSEDNLAICIKNWNLPKVRYLALPAGKNGKKAAISMGVSSSTSEIIAVTDADSQPGHSWLETIESYFSKNENLDMITGLVLPAPVDSLLGRFQWLDFAATMSLTRMGISRSWFFIANGANMAFRKSAFQSVQGYQGNEHVASGDDVFLIAKIASQSGKWVAFMHERQALVTTKSESSWNDLWNQRKRWAQKTKAYASRDIVMIQGLVFILSLLSWISIPPAILGNSTFIFVLLMAGGGKMAIDYWFLKRLSFHFAQPEVLKRFSISWLIYQSYIVLIGITALFPGKSRWKNRVTG